MIILTLLLYQTVVGGLFCIYLSDIILLGGGGPVGIASHNLKKIRRGGCTLFTVSKCLSSFILFYL